MMKKILFGVTLLAIVLLAIWIVLNIRTKAQTASSQPPVPSEEQTGNASKTTKPEPRSINVELFQFGISPDPLVLHAGETVRLVLSTRDVAHSFSMGDEGFEAWNFLVRPGKPIEHVLVVPDLPGEYVVACDVFCGKGHNEMRGTVRVLPAS